MGPDIGATLPAGLAGELVLDVGKPDIISPAIGAHFDRVAAFVVGTVDQDAVDAGFPHLSESDFLLAGEFGHFPMIPPIAHQGKPLGLGFRNASARCRSQDDDRPAHRSPRIPGSPASFRRPRRSAFQVSGGGQFDFGSRLEKGRPGAHIPRMETIVKCDCGADYKRTEAKFLMPHTGHVSCEVCGAVLKSRLESTHFATFELVKRPDRKPV